MIPKQSPKRLAAIADGTWKPKPRKRIARRNPVKAPIPASKASKVLARGRTKQRPKRKPTGQAKVFREIWEARAHRCEVCKATILQPAPWNFSHLLPKGTYPDFMLDPRNIVIKCKGCHDLWHKHGAAGLRYSHPWVHVVRLRDELHTEAHA